MKFRNKLGFIIAATVLISGLVSASPAALNLFPDSSSTRIDSFTAYELEVENTGPAKDVYTLSSSTPAEITIAPQQVELDSGDSETVNVWFNPRTDRDEGTYSFQLTAESRASGDRFSETGTVEIIKDHQVDLSVENSKTACLGQNAVYTVEVENTGIQPEEFSVSSDFGQLSRNTVNLEDGETAELTLEMSSQTPVERNFQVVAASTTSYAQDIENVQFNAENCFDSEVSVTPQNQRTAAGTEAEFEVTVDNLGTRADDFTVEASQGELSATSFNVDSGATETVTLSVTPEELGTREIQVSASGNSQSSDTATLEAYNGMNSEISFENEARTVCEDKSTTFTAEVENTGEAAETFTLQTSTGELQTSEVELSPGDSEEVEVEVPESTEVGTHEVTLTSTASTFGEPSATSTSTLTVENCWDLDMQVVPEVASAGENRSAIYKIHLNNTGTRENTYELSKEEGPEWVSIRPEEVTVAAGQTETAYIYAGVPFQKKGEVKITAQAQGTDITRSKTVQLLIGQDVEESIESERNSLTGGFMDRVSVPEGEAGRAGIAVVAGAAITAAVLYFF
ncbi:MAG: putative membrane protein [Candidatus Nanohaloarchaea archaeon]|jgi:uncharacterized membrane protein